MNFDQGGDDDDEDDDEEGPVLSFFSRMSVPVLFTSHLNLYSNLCTVKFTVRGQKYGLLPEISRHFSTGPIRL